MLNGIVGSKPSFGKISAEPAKVVTKVGANEELEVKFAPILQTMVQKYQRELVAAKNELQATRQQLDSLKLELDVRPSIKQWKATQRELSELGGQAFQKIR
jgi:cell fate (sporulation/competence/biofilm development) regulator YmcA (YheA/YmcA/DUF963 family)